jgi:alpha-beta hydrolase superfamily lysophospholipase
MARTPRWAQCALDSLSHSRFFANVAKRAIVGDLKQVCAYLTDDTRREVGERVARCVGDDTRVVVGHSLGSGVAYEALCTSPEWPVTTWEHRSAS